MYGVLVLRFARRAWKRLCQLSGATVGLAALLLAGCATPGGIYKGYEGSPRRAENLAILEWMDNPYRRVTHIDGEFLHEGQPFLGGVAITIAHLQPGHHTITVNNNWGKFLRRGFEDVVVRVHLKAGNAYGVRDVPCRECDPFAVDFLIVNSKTEAVVGRSTRYGEGTYRQIKRRQIEECREECESEWRSCMGYRWKKNRDRCDKEKASCRVRVRAYYP